MPEKREKSLYRNSAFLVGELITEFTPATRIPNRRGNFYEATVRIRRNRGLGREDDVLVIVHKDTLSSDIYQVRDRVFLRGRLESCRVNENFRRKEIHFFRCYHLEKTNSNDSSNLQISGYLCSDPIVRPVIGGSGKYTLVAELTISVTRKNPIRGTDLFLSDYIHAILFNEEAEKAKEYKKGDYIKGSGRVQARKIHKKNRTVYELMLSQHTVDSSINSFTGAIEVKKRKNRAEEPKKDQKIVKTNVL